MTPLSDINRLVHEMKTRGENFAVATVVRTVSATAAKPGAKAVIDADGIIVDGWIGGGCARGAVVKAARHAIADGQPRLVSILPEELLHEQAMQGGEQHGVIMARNLCPSQGSMDVFVEPVLANPCLLILGASPVALALASMAGAFDLSVELHGMDQTMVATGDDNAWQTGQVGGAVFNGYTTVKDAVTLRQQHPHRYIAISTQGSGDLRALVLASTLEARHVSFVGSSRKTDHLRQKLIEQGCSERYVQGIKGPAGLDIGAVTPQEIALSIIAEIVAIRRSSGHEPMQGE